MKSIKLQYFDMVLISKSRCILESGFLFVASESGNNHIHQFEKLGGYEVEFTSDDASPVFFQSGALRDLTLVESINGMKPLLASEVANLAGDEDAPQIYSACGIGVRSQFRMLKHGVEVNEIATLELPSTASAVWTTKLNVKMYTTHTSSSPRAASLCS